MRAAAAASTPWRPLGLDARELRLGHTLPTGQSFGWRKVALGDAADGPVEYRGVLGDAAVALREAPDGATEWRAAAAREADAFARLSDYFRADVSFADLYEAWGAADARLAAVAPAVAGVRVLRQDPFECLISFICSSNNNIARISLMLGKLRGALGEDAPLPPLDDGEPVTLKAFPTPDALGAVDEQFLRDLGFGYRAPYRRPSGTRARRSWLVGLLLQEDDASNATKTSKAVAQSSVDARRGRRRRRLSARPASADPSVKRCRRGVPRGSSQEPRDRRGVPRGSSQEPRDRRGVPRGSSEESRDRRGVPRGSSEESRRRRGRRRPLYGHCRPSLLLYGHR